MNVDLRVVENPLVEVKNKSLTYKVHENTNEVSCCEKIESTNMASTVRNVDKESKSLNVSFCEQTRSNNTLSCTLLTMYNTEGRITLEGLDNLYDGIRSLLSKLSDLDSSYDEIKSNKSSGSRVISYDRSDLDNPLLIGSKVLNGVVSDDKKE